MNDGPETEDRLSCCACGKLLDGGDRSYQFGDERVICFSCAIHRGGEYDEGGDRWASLPDVGDVAVPES